MRRECELCFKVEFSLALLPQLLTFLSYLLVNRESVSKQRTIPRRETLVLYIILAL